MYLSELTNIWGIKNKINIKIFNNVFLINKCIYQNWPIFGVLRIKEKSNNMQTHKENKLSKTHILLLMYTFSLVIFLWKFVWSKIPKLAFFDYEYHKKLIHNN